VALGRFCYTLVLAATVASCTAASGEEAAGSWSVEVLIERTRTYAIAVDDLDGDGFEDFVLSLHGPDFNPPDQLWFWADDGYEPRIVLPNIDRHGCAIADVDGDGLPDVFCQTYAQSGRGLGSSELWLQQPDGTYVDRATEWGVADPYGRGRHPVLADFNGNGLPDLYLTNGGGPREDGLRNENQFWANFHEHGRMVEVTTPATGQIGHRCAAAGNIASTGRAALAVCGATLRLFQGESNGLTEVTDEFGQEVRWPRHAVFADLTGDGLDDLVIVSARRVEIRLNSGGDGRFAQVAHTHGLEHGQYAAVGDVTGNGHLDIYVVQTCQDPRDGPFVNTPDVLLEGPTWAPVDGLPQVATGCGDAAAIVNGQVVLLNGFRQAYGPVVVISR